MAGQRPDPSEGVPHDGRASAGPDAGQAGPELTLRGALLGAAIVAVFTAANLYLGLRTGMTFSTSIPAALIAMACLRAVGGGILENNIVQTEASAAGTLCNVILVLPGLVMVGAWQGFPFWPTVAVCLLGGWLGVAFSIPLRRALVARGNLPYPEGVAAAAVLRAGAAGAGGAPLRELAGAAAASAGIAVLTDGLRLLGGSVVGTLALRSAVFRVGTGFSPALVGVGYLIGIGACLALLLGVGLAWGIAVPLLTAWHGLAGRSPAEAAEAIWSGEVRLIGAGIMATGGLWTVARLVRPVLATLRGGEGAGGGRADRRERDLPLPGVAVAVAALAAGVAALAAWAGAGAGTVLAATALAVPFGFAMAAACGYLAGLLGSSSSPISGIGLLTAMAAALVLPLVGVRESALAIELALLLTAVIVTAASIANDNLQDLKTGQLVGATPWRQQVALIGGVAAGAMVIAPVLALLDQAYGLAGAPSRPGLPPGAALPAPQATLVTAIVRGIVEHTLPWPLVVTGVALGVPLVLLEAWARRRKLTFPALSVGIGMYLPLDVEVTIAIGGLVAFLSGRVLRGAGEAAREAATGRGVRLASGLLVGESLTGVVLAGADALRGRPGSLALAGPGFAPWATGLGALVFVAVLVAFGGLASRPPAGANQPP